MTERTPPTQPVLVLSKTGRPPAWLEAWWQAASMVPELLADAGTVLAVALRARPRSIVVDGCGDAAWQDEALATCRRLKRDSFTAIVPVVMIVPPSRFGEAFLA